jgi:hypothetical protein
MADLIADFTKAVTEPVKEQMPGAGPARGCAAQEEESSAGIPAQRIGEEHAALPAFALSDAVGLNRDAAGVGSWAGVLITGEDDDAAGQRDWAADI